MPLFLQTVDTTLTRNGESIRRDFSHNRLVGSLADMSGRVNGENSSTLDGFLNKPAVAMNVNRLSGDVPTNYIIRQLRNINILAGNIFACDNYDDLPQHDPHYHFYSCGSDILDLTLILWMSFLSFMLIIAITGKALSFRHKSNHQEGVSEQEEFFIYKLNGLFVKLRLWYNTMKGLNHNDMKNAIQFHETLAFVRIFAFYITCFIVSAFLMLYWFGKSKGGWYTHSHQYRWLFTAAYLSGSGAASTLMVLLFLLLFLSVWFVSQHTERHRRIVTECSDGNSFSSAKPMNVLSLIACFFLNGIVVLSVQGSFVYAVTWYDISPTIVVMLQLLLACFSIIWDNIFVLKVIIAWFSKYLTLAGRIQLQNVLIIFNGVVAPLIVVGFTDPTCFSELISSSLEISTTTSYDICSDVGISGGCMEYTSKVSKYFVFLEILFALL